jgi:inosose dehydratase
MKPKQYKNIIMKTLLRTVIFLLSFTQMVNAQEAKRPDPQPAPETTENFRLGIAGYTFYKFDLQKTLETLKKTDVHYLCIKSFHLPLESTNEEIKAFHAKLADFGVEGYAVGPLYMKTEEEADKIFEYAKRAGVNTIVGVPTYELLPYVSKKVAEYDIKFAIHLHGPDIEIFPDADDVWENVKNLDPRIGMCLDIGHDRRNGKDPVADLKKYHSRVFDIHLKDVTAASKEGYSVEVGRGILDIPGFVKMLRKVNYTGVVSLEHERNMDNPFMGIAESIGYFRGVVAATQKK